MSDVHPKDLLEQAYQEFYAGRYDRALEGFRAVLEHPQSSEHDKVEAQECISIVQPEPSHIAAAPSLDEPRHDNDEYQRAPVYDVQVDDVAQEVASEAEERVSTFEDENANENANAEDDEDSLPVPADPFADMPGLVEFGDEAQAQPQDELEVMMMADSKRHVEVDSSVASAAQDAGAVPQQEEAQQPAAAQIETAQGEPTEQDDAVDAEAVSDLYETDEFPGLVVPDSAHAPEVAHAYPAADDGATLDELNDEMTLQVNRVVELEGELDTIRSELHNRGSEVQSLHDLVRTLTQDLEARNREIVELQRRIIDLAESQQSERTRQAQEQRQQIQAERERIADETRKLIEREFLQQQQKQAAARRRSQSLESEEIERPRAPQTESYTRLSQQQRLEPANGNGSRSGNGNGNGNGKGRRRGKSLHPQHPSSAAVFGPSEPPRHPTPTVYRSLTDRPHRDARQDEDETRQPSISAMTTRLTVSTPNLSAPSSSDHMSVYTVSQRGQGLVVRTGLRRHRRPVNVFALLGCLGLVLATLLPWHVSATNMMLGLGELGQLLSTHRPTIAPDTWLSLVDLLWLLPVFAVFLLVWEGIHWGQGYNGHLMHALVGVLMLGLVVSVFGLMPSRDAGASGFAETLLVHSEQLQLGAYVALGSCVLLIVGGLVWPRRRRGGRRYYSDEASSTTTVPTAISGMQVPQPRSSSYPASAVRGPSSHRQAAASSGSRRPVAPHTDSAVSSRRGIRARS